MGYVYKITNTVNGKSYIGKTIHDPEKGRIHSHFNGKAPECRALCNAIKKYGKNAFTYKILHKDIIPELLDIFEIEAIKSHNSLAPNGYNLTTGGEGGSPSEETLKKMSLAQRGKTLTPEHRKKIGDAHQGKKHSAAARRNMSEAHTGKPHPNRGKTLTPERRQQLSDIAKGRRHSPESKAKISAALKETFRRKGGHSPESKAKISAALKSGEHRMRGKKLSKEHREKIGHALLGRKHPRRRHPERCDVQSVFSVLPPDMKLSEKYRFLYANFPSIDKGTIRKWVRP